MCGKLRILGRIVQPGSTLRITTEEGMVDATWGSNGSYNAKFESMQHSWKNWQAGILLAEGFYERGVYFHSGVPLKIAVLHNDITNEFVVVTRPAAKEVILTHKRMPLLIRDSALWIKGRLYSSAKETLCSISSTPQNRDLFK